MPFFRFLHIVFLEKSEIVELQSGATATALGCMLLAPWDVMDSPIVAYKGMDRYLPAWVWGDTLPRERSRAVGCPTLNGEFGRERVVKIRRVVAGWLSLVWLVLVLVLFRTDPRLPAIPVYAVLCVSTAWIYHRLGALLWTRAQSP